MGTAKETKAALSDSAPTTSAAKVPICTCGVPMKPVGRGQFPYPCIAQDKHPNPMVYESDGCGHSAWDWRE